MIVRWFLALALLLSPSLALAQATMTGGAVTPGGRPLDINPNAQFIQSCNAGAGGFVGQGNCTLPTSATPSGTQNVNVVQTSGTATSVSNGATDAGTQRVTLSNDSTGQVKATNFPATVSTGTGAQGANSPRVTVATDANTVAGSASLPAGPNLIGKVGIDQTTPGTTNGVQATNFPATVSTGNGATDAGTQRVTLSNDSTGQVKTNQTGVNGVAPAVGAGTSNTGTIRVVQASDQNVPSLIKNTYVPTGTGLFTLSISFTRPNNTTAYATGQLFANSTTAGSVVPLAFDVSALLPIGAVATINETRIRVAGLTVVMTGGLTLHTFSAAPTPTVGDGGAYNASNVLASNGFATYLGQPATATNILAFSDGSMAYAGSTAATFTVPANGIIYGLLQTNGAWTPNANAVVTVDLVIRP